MVNYLLLLHGYTQNGSIIHRKMSKLLGNQILSRYTVIVPDGPYVIEEGRRGWWRLSQPETFTKEQVYDNYHQAIDLVKSLLPVINKDDTLTVMAFSQGTVLVEIMVALELLHPDKIMLFSPSGVMDCNILKKRSLSIPIIIMMGQKEEIDGINPQHYAQYTCFEDYTLIQHKQGHVIPSQSCDKQIIKEFLTKCK